MKKLIFFLFVFISVPSYAILDLELTQGVAASVPVAVSPFSGEQVKVEGGQQFAQVLQNDLQHSGEFRVLTQSDLQQKNTQAEWRTQGADYLITGSIEKTSSQGYLVHFQLKSLFDSKQDPSIKLGETLLSESYSSPTDSMRSLAHHISDEIYEKLTGIRGVFSTRVAYVLVKHPRQSHTSYQLVVADADGFNPQTLLSSSQPIMSPAWSPDGNKLAYVSFEGHRAAIYVQNLSTGSREVVSQSPGINGAPAFSPDGKNLAIVLTKTGNPKIYLLELATKHLTQVTDGWSIDTEPAFSPDGSSLLFTSNRDGSPQIYQYSIPTGSLTRLTFDGNYNARPSFSHDGQSIVVMHRDHGNYGIARLDLSSGHMMLLSELGDNESPSLSPNSKMIIYSTNYKGRGVLAQVSLDGNIKIRLPSKEGEVQDPAWSPFLT